MPELTNYERYLQEQMKIPEVKEAYDALEPEFTIMQAMIDARRESGLSQQELARRTGIPQADISKIENGNANPSIKTLKRLANGLGRKLIIQFTPVGA